MQVIQKIKNFVGSHQFFYIILGLFFVSSLWIALSGQYPMAFDENYHYGIIKAYSKQFGPFFSSPPLGTESLGDITRYPSYLFHYVMSFPYRFISFFTDTETIKIIFLRLLNIGLLASSLFIFKKIFGYLRIGKVAGNLALLFFVLTPVVPFLAAQINYDNVVIPLTGLAILLFLKSIEEFRSRKLSVSTLGTLVIVCLIASLVKYTFLPVFAGLFLAGSFIAFKEARKQKIDIMVQLKSSFTHLKRLPKGLLIAGLMLSSVLFIERYGVNIVKYHTPVPDCEQVVSVESCLSYGPWARDYRLKADKTGPPSWGPVRYSGHWAAQGMHELFFAIDQNYYEQSPLPMPYYAAWVFGGSGLLLMMVSWRKLRQVPHVGWLLFVIVFYVVVLWLNNYQRFVSVNWPVAIHGRYVLPLLPLIYVLLASGFRNSFTKLKGSMALKTTLLALALLAMLQGGLVTYIVRSQAHWYWPSRIVIKANAGARTVLEKLVIH